MKKVIFATLVALGAPALADNRETAASFMQCARIADDARRLGCYDRLATDLIELGLGNMSPAAPPAAGVAATSAPPTAPGVATSSAPPPSAAVPAAPVVETPRAPEPEVVASAVPVTAPPPEAVTASAPAPATPAPAASPAPQSSAEEAFGSERTEAGQDKALKEIKSRYVGEFRGWTGKTVFELENGQVWQQTRSGRMMWRADSPMITIKRGFMGGYRLSVEGVNKEVYVKRIK